MNPNYSVQRARECLREQFGANWQAPYAPGKARMASCLADRLIVPHEAAVQVVEEMEREGVLRFEGITGRTASPPAHRTAGRVSRSPLTPDVVNPEAAPATPELGTWFIE